MGESRKYGLIQDLLLVAISVSSESLNQPPVPASFFANALLIFALLLQTFSMYYVAKSLLSNLQTHDPEREQHEQARVKAVANLRRLDRSKDHDDSEGHSGRDDDGLRRARKEDLVLDQYESQIAMEVVAPEDIPVGFDSLFDKASL
jgi:hypothetical protein